MRRSFGVLVLSASLVACSGGGDDTDSTAVDGEPALQTSGAPDDAPDESNDGTAGGSVVDCALVKGPDRGSLIGMQLIPQMITQSAIDSIKSSLGFNSEDLIAYLEALRPLGGRDYEPFGDPADEIERYITAATAARELLAIEGPVPQATLDEFAATVGDPAEFLMGQAAIGVAIDENCP